MSITSFYSQYPHFLKLDEIAEKCPVFGKGVCPYGGLTDKLKDITGNCPAFKDRCPFKSLKTAGEPKCETKAVAKVVQHSKS